jgi:TRAP-type mannitol/chloroaromatic compound transport system permease small subunit
MSAALASLNLWIGRVISWLTVAMVLVMSIVVVERYWFSSGSIRMQESITFMHAAVFMLAAAYTLAAGDHVRVDIFYSTMSRKGKALVDLLGCLVLLLPVCIFMIWSSWDYVSVSWTIQEASRETGGLPFPFPAVMKSFIPASSLLLVAQAIVMIIAAIQTLRGQGQDQIRNQEPAA